VQKVPVGTSVSLNASEQTLVFVDGRAAPETKGVLCWYCDQAEAVDRWLSHAASHKFGSAGIGI